VIIGLAGAKQSGKTLLARSGGEPKECRGCGEAKPSSAFSLKYGRPRARCKACCAKENSAWAAKNPERHKAIQRKANAKYDKKPDVRLARLERKRRWNHKNREALAAKAREYSKKPEALARVKARRAKNPIPFRQRHKRWAAKNKHAVAAHVAKRRCSKINATPRWLSAEDKARIRGVYAEAKKLEAITGERHAVDHVVPLISAIVCGLHVPWNLQAITRSENARKRNRLDGIAA
jgi:hypothetical protein